MVLILAFDTIKSVKVLPIDSQLNEECLEKLPPGSFVIIDDFQLLTKTSQWQRVVNYCAHHFSLSIFLVVHSHQNTEGLHYALKNASNIYLTYSNNSKYFLKSIANGKYLNFFCRHWKEGIANKHICFIKLGDGFCDYLIVKGMGSVGSLLRGICPWAILSVLRPKHLDKYPK